MRVKAWQPTAQVGILRDTKTKNPTQANNAYAGLKTPALLTLSGWSYQDCSLQTICKVSTADEKRAQMS